MKKLMISGMALLALAGLCSADLWTNSLGQVFVITGTNMVQAYVPASTNTTETSGQIRNADIATNAAIAKTKLAAAVQTSLGLADTSLQQNSVNLTNTWVDKNTVTNTMIILKGRVTSWTQAGP